MSSCAVARVKPSTKAEPNGIPNLDNELRTRHVPFIHDGYRKSPGTDPTRLESGVSVMASRRGDNGGVSTIDEAGSPKDAAAAAVPIAARLESFGRMRFFALVNARRAGHFRPQRTHHKQPLRMVMLLWQWATPSTARRSEA